MSFLQDQKIDKLKAEAIKKYQEVVNPKASTTSNQEEVKDSSVLQNEEEKTKAPVPFYKNKWVIGITIVAVLSVAGVIIYKMNKKK
jgi:hypothetical protein